MTVRKNEPDKARRILAAVSGILARRGYEEATIAQIAAEAGVSRGLLHYYFKNKEDMMAQAVKAGAQVSLEVIARVFQAGRTDADLAGNFSQGLNSIAAGDPDFINLLLESWAVSRRSRVVAAEVKSNYRLFREAVGRELEKAAAEKRISPEIPVETLAAILIGLFDGLGLQMVAEPELSADPALIEAIHAVVIRLLTA
ncbi:MAG: TetR/AcrR family transcriptional regulator [Thermodesulfobacteriota bacterium]